jgi:hypothetical protein
MSSLVIRWVGKGGKHSRCGKGFVLRGLMRVAVMSERQRLSFYKNNCINYLIVLRPLNMIRVPVFSSSRTIHTLSISLHSNRQIHPLWSGPTKKSISCPSPYPPPPESSLSLHNIVHSVGVSDYPGSAVSVVVGRRPCALPHGGEFLHGVGCTRTSTGTGRWGASRRFGELHVYTIAPVRVHLIHLIHLTCCGLRCVALRVYSPHAPHHVGETAASAALGLTAAMLPLCCRGAYLEVVRSSSAKTDVDPCRCLLCGGVRNGGGKIVMGPYVCYLFVQL